jgi:hypothetical protein
VWDATRHYLRAGGWPQINSSHGDASIAVLEPSLTVVAAAPHRSDRYRVTTKRLHDCLLAMVWAGTGALDVTCELLADGQWQSSGDPRLAVPPAERLRRDERELRAVANSEMLSPTIEDQGRPGDIG